MTYQDAETRRAYVREYMASYRPAWYADNKTKARAYQRAYFHNSRAAQFGVEGRITYRDVLDLLRDGSECAYCGTTENLTVDHIVGLHAGGPNTTDNLQACCHRCNTSKGRRDRPGCWSELYEFDACIDCKRSDRKHKSRGLCTACYKRSRITKEPTS